MARSDCRKTNPRGRPDRSQSLSPITAPEQYGRLWKAKSSHETCHLRLPLAASTEAAWACSASIRLISRRMRARLIRILSGLLLIRLAGLAVKGVCGRRAISVPFPHAVHITRRMFRFYGPEKPLFDKTWKLPDIEVSESVGGR